MSQQRPSIIPSDYDYSDYISDSGEAVPEESEVLVTRRPDKRGQNRRQEEDYFRGQHVYEAAYDNDHISVTRSRYKHPEARRSYGYNHPYSFR